MQHRSDICPKAVRDGLPKGFGHRCHVGPKKCDFAKRPHRARNRINIIVVAPACPTTSYHGTSTSATTQSTKCTQAQRSTARARRTCDNTHNSKKHPLITQTNANTQLPQPVPKAPRIKRTQLNQTTNIKLPGNQSALIPIEAKPEHAWKPLHV